MMSLRDKAYEADSNLLSKASRPGLEGLLFLGGTKIFTKLVIYVYYRVATKFRYGTKDDIETN